MADTKISALTSYSNPDAANDVIPIVDNANSSTKKITRNAYLGLTSAPVGLTDTQVLTNKTLTAPTLTSPILSGTITGTYTLAGTPTFPSSVVTLTGAQTLTNKILTSPTISSPTITNASITADAITGFSSANTGSIYGMAITNSAIPNSALPSGTVVQIQSTNYSAMTTGTTVLPSDDTIPQSNEGDQYMTQAITPKSAANRMIIEITALFSGSIGPADVTMALFQDSTANALAGRIQTYANATYMQNLYLTHDMVTGTTSATTFKVRAGLNSAGTTTFNGQSGTRRLGGITISNIKVTEYKP